MRKTIYGITQSPHPEERLKGASRRTLDACPTQASIRRRVVEEGVTAAFELRGEALVAGAHDAAVAQDVDDVGHDIVEQALVMRDYDRGVLGRAKLVDAVGDDAQRVDIKPAIGLVEDRELRLEHRHLEDLVALLLTAGEADIDGALQQILADIEELQLGAHGFEELAGAELGLAARAVHGVERGAQEIQVVHAGDLDRVLEGEEDTGARPLIGREREEILSEIKHA